MNIKFKKYLGHFKFKETGLTRAHVTNVLNPLYKEILGLWPGETAKDSAKNDALKKQIAAFAAGAAAHLAKEEEAKAEGSGDV